MKEGKPVEIPDEDWAQTPPAVRAFVSQSVTQIEQLEAELQAARPKSQAISAAVQGPALPPVAAIEPTIPLVRPRRTLNRLALIVLAVAGAAAGQSILAQDSLWDGLLLYTLAVLLFVWGLRDAAAPGLFQPWPGLARPLQLRQWPVRALGLALLAGSLFLSFLAYRAFGQKEMVPAAWNLYLYSLVGLLAGMMLLTRGEVSGQVWPRSSLFRWLLALVFLLAIFMRLWQFDSLPFGTWYDEAISGLQGVRWNTEISYRPQFEENNSGQLIFLYATALRWLGQTTTAIRLVSVVLGLAGVAAAYLFGSELRGPRFGLILAFFVAVARWHVNFSRIAMPGIDTPFTEFLTLFFLLRLWRYGRLRDAAWAGAALGLGLSLYSAFRLFGLALGIFVLLSGLIGWKWWWARRHEKQWRLNLGSRLLLAGLALWLTALPIIHFARHNSTAFWARVQYTSIINRRDEPDLAKAIWRSAHLHLLMFNFHGDKNGRHNLSSAPMLDPAMGVFFVLGFGLALARLKRPANLFFLILFPAGLLGGMLSLDFEAPQSLRSIAVLPSVFYFCALSVEALGRQALVDLRPWPVSWLAAPALALAGFIFYSNAHTYFYRQAQSLASWQAFSTAESITGKKMAELGSNYVFYVSPFFNEHPSIRFLSPRTPDRRLLTLPDALPIRQPANRPAALFIHPDDEWVYQAARNLYPAARFGTVVHEQSGTPVVFIGELMPEDLERVQGLELAYWPNQTWEGSPRTRIEVANIDVSWPDAASFAVSSGSLTEFAAEWTGTLYAPVYGMYQFSLNTPAGASLEINGEAQINVENGGLHTASLSLAQGNHRFRLRAQGGVGPVSLGWQRPDFQAELVPQWVFYRSPVTNHGLQGTYYANDNWEGAPALARIDPFIDTYFHITPLPRPYSVEWVGVLVAPQAGSYGLGLRAIDWAELYLDDRLLLETTQPGVYIDTHVTLEQGVHDLRLRFKDTVGRSRLHLWWQPPGQAEAGAIPRQYFWPSRESYIETEPVELPSPEAAAAFAQVDLLSLPASPSAVRMQIISTPFGDTPLSQPRGIAAGPNGRIYVADSGNQRLLILDQEGRLVSEVSGGAEPFDDLSDVATDRSGRVYVLDAGRARLSLFDGEGEYVGEVPAQPDYLGRSRGLFVDDLNRLWLANTSASRLAAVDTAGIVLTEFPVAPGVAAQPVDVAVMAGGDIYSTDIILDQLIRFGPDGPRRESWTIPHSTSADGPHLAVDAAGGVYVTLPDQGRVIRFDPATKTVKSWELVRPDGQKMTPVGVAVDAEGRIWTVDSAGGNIVVLAAAG